ncbi:MAG: sulfatase [Planctomycetales bacterium]|nr:sulfatase [Planctomycetales bacterium]
MSVFFMKGTFSRHWLVPMLASAFWVSCASFLLAAGPTGERLPNFVIIYIDDMGYADIGPFGAKQYQTPNLDRMAAEGRKFTDFYVAQAVCGASRAALLTGCYPNRIGLLGAPGPGAKHGIHAEETTIAEVLQQRDYATAIFGKWHLGDARPFLPLQNGFDEYYGLPYSNDMWPFHPTAKHFPDLPLIAGNKVINPKVTPDDQRQLTVQYTEHAVDFIDRHHEQPFFLYVPHSMVHVPLYVSDRFAGKSGVGLFGDVMMEVDWSVGEILGALRRHKIESNTLVVFAADNGPWLSYGNHAGSAGPLREGKGTSWDGGTRVSCLMWQPGVVPANSVCREPAMTIDLLPTIAKRSGAALPARKIDGKNIWPLIAGVNGAKSPHEAYYYYWGHELQGVRSGRWSLHFPHNYRTLAGEPGKDGIPGPYKQGHTELALFDLQADIGQQTNLAESHPEVVARLKSLAAQARQELGDSATRQKGAGVREPGRI